MKFKTYELIDFCEDGTETVIATTETTCLESAEKALANYKRNMGSDLSFIRQRQS